MDSIKLEKMPFFGFHGVAEEERIIGNRYEVSVEVFADLSAAAESDHVGDTIDYQGIYKIVKQEMDISAKLLEHLAGRILKRLDSELDRVKKATVIISKMNPPIKGICKSSTVTMTRDFD